MKTLENLIEKNKQWAAAINRSNPDLFDAIADKQQPEYLWIGCADSRVPATLLLGLLPGNVFTHRNIANMVVHSDLNCLSVIQYAVEVLKVKHVLVCGHYGCAGVKAACSYESFGLIDNWLRNIHDVEEKHRSLVQSLKARLTDAKFSQEVIDEKSHSMMCELNAIEQVINVTRVGSLQSAWKAKQAISVHALIYGVGNGLLQQIGNGIQSQQEVVIFRQKAIEEITRRYFN